MANKTYYEQNYPTTKYEYSSRGYRNGRTQSAETRPINMQYNELPAANVDYPYYQAVTDGYEKEGSDQWEYQNYIAQKQKPVHNSKKTCSQLAVNTPRYYRNMAHRRPSALCIPLLAQPEPRRKPRSQMKFENFEKPEPKTARYRVKQQRHHLLPPPPSLPHNFVPPAQNEHQADFETSSGDGRHSLRSQTQSSGSLSVDISSQVEILNQSFEAVTREHKGKKIVYSDVQPMYNNADPSQVKSRRSHRRHMKKNKHVNETADSWGNQLWDLPEDIQGEENWSEKVETDWTNVQPQHVSPCVTNVTQGRRKSNNRKPHNHHHNFYHQQSLPPAQTSQIQQSRQHQQPSGPSIQMQTQSQQLLQPQLQPQLSHQQALQSQPQQQNSLAQHRSIPTVPSKLLDPNLPRPRTRSGESQGTVLNQGMNLGSAQSDQQMGTERINYLENLFSEVFAQGRFDNLSKKTRLDFIQDAYNKYSSSFEDIENKNVAVNTEPTEIGNMFSEEYPPQGNPWYESEYEKNVEENLQFNQVHFDNHNHTNHLNEEPTKKSSISQNEFGKMFSPVPNQDLTNPADNPANLQNVTNFLLNVKPRRRTMKLEENSKNDNVNIPRFPNLIENMSARYLGSSNSGKKDSSGFSETSDGSQNQNGPTYKSSSHPLQKQEYEYSQQKNVTGNVPRLRKGNEVQNQQNVYNVSGALNNNNQEVLQAHYSANVGNQNCVSNNYVNSDNCYIYREHDTHEQNNYCNTENVDNNFNEQYNYNCSLPEDMNKLNINSAYDNNEDYSSNMENNYLTIRKCQEILNQVKENFGECLNNNSEGFIDGNEQFVDANDAAQDEIYPRTGYDHESSNTYNNQAMNQHIQSQRNETAYPQNVNEMEMSHNDYDYEYQDNRMQNNQIIEDSKLNDYRRTANDNRTQDIQTEFCSREENVQNYSDYDNTLCQNDENHDFSTQEQANTHDSYTNIDQEKVKQFIHSLTGFDALQISKSGNGDNQGNEEYHDSVKYLPDQTNCGKHSVHSSLLSASDNILSPEHHRTRYHGHPRAKSKAVGTIDKHRHYSMPQRQEIERMQQDCQSDTYEREKEESHINYSDFPHEVPNRSRTRVQECKRSGPNELGRTEYTKLNEGKTANDNRSAAEDMNKTYYYSQCGENQNYNTYDCTYNQADDVNYNQTQNTYCTNVSYDMHTQQENPQLCSNQRVMIDQEQEPYYDGSDNNNKQYQNNKNMLDQRIDCLDNDEGYPVHHHEQNYEEPEYPEDNCDDSKHGVLKRKYCYMPSANYEGNIENAVNDQSCYKSYIENLIDNSLQNSRTNIAAGGAQNMNQGPVIQGQNDVVELETDKAIDLVMNESACQMDSKLCLEITQRLTDTLVQSNKDIPTPCLVALEEPVYLQQLKKLRWDHLRHIEREVKRLESLERFLDTCGCGHMMYTKNAG